MGYQPDENDLVERRDFPYILAWRGSEPVSIKIDLHTCHALKWCDNTNSYVAEYGGKRYLVTLTDGYGNVNIVEETLAEA